MVIVPGPKPANTEAHRVAPEVEHTCLCSNSPAVTSHRCAGFRLTTRVPPSARREDWGSLLPSSADLAASTSCWRRPQDAAAAATPWPLWCPGAIRRIILTRAHERAGVHVHGFSGRGGGGGRRQVPEAVPEHADPRLGPRQLLEEKFVRGDGRGRLHRQQEVEAEERRQPSQDEERSSPHEWICSSFCSTSKTMRLNGMKARALLSMYRPRLVRTTTQEIMHDLRSSDLLFCLFEHTKRA
jgi:hypothetical protein